MKLFKLPKLRDFPSPIIFIIDSLTNNDYTYLLASALAKRHNSVVLITQSNRHFDPNHDFIHLAWAPPKGNGGNRLIKTVHYAVYLLMLLCLFLSYRKKAVIHWQFFRRERVDSLFLFVVRFLKVTQVHTLHNILPHEADKFDQFFRRLVVHSVDKVIVHSPYLSDKVKDQFEIPGKKVAIVPHGNYNHYLRFGLPSKEEAREEFELTLEDDVLLFFGVIRQYKGVEILLQAFERAHRINRALRLIIAGEVMAPEVEQRIHELTWEKKFAGALRYFPYRIPPEKVSSFFAACDLVVLPYTRIYHSGVLHLAYSFAKPVLATSVGDFPQMITHGENGFLVPPLNPDAMADEIIKIFQQKRKLSEIGRYNKRISDTNWDWDRIAGLTFSEYRETFSMKNGGLS